MHRQINRFCFAGLCSLGSFGVSAHACDGYVVTRPAQATHVVYREVPVATHSTVAYSVRKPVISIEPAIVAVERPVVAELSVTPVERRTRVFTGTTLNVNTLFLGKETGVVFLRYGAVTQRCSVHRWDAENVTFTLPSLDINSEIDATIVLVRPSGDVAKRLAVRLAAPDSLVQVPTPSNIASSDEVFDEVPATPVSVSFSSTLQN